MKHKFICTATLDDGTEIGELFTSDTQRKSKVVKLVNQAFKKKHGMEFTQLKNAYIGKLPRNYETQKSHKTSSADI